MALSATTMLSVKAIVFDYIYTITSLHLCVVLNLSTFGA